LPRVKLKFLGLEICFPDLGYRLLPLLEQEEPRNAPTCRETQHDDFGKGFELLD
jgi:hypothetical protein